MRRAVLVPTTNEAAFDKRRLSLFLTILVANLLGLALVATSVQAQGTPSEKNVPEQAQPSVEKVSATEATTVDTVAPGKGDEAKTDVETKQAAAQDKQGVDKRPDLVAQVDDTGRTLVFAEGRESATVVQRASQLAGPLSGTRVSTRSTDPDREVEVILIPRQDCDLVGGRTASFVLEDEDGTQADFVFNPPDGDPEGNIQIKKFSNGLRVTTSGTEPNDIVPLNERGGIDDVLDTGGLVIVTSTGITCEGDPGGGGGGTSDPPKPTPKPGEDENVGDDREGQTVADGCTTLRLFEGDERVSETFGIPADSTGRLRIVYSTLNDDGELAISVGTVQTRAVGFSETISGSESGVIRENVDEDEQIAISVVPKDQDYRVVLESVGGDDECTTPRAVRGVLAESIPDDELLPETGGVSLSGLAGGVAILLAGTVLVGTVAKRRM